MLCTGKFGRCVCFYFGGNVLRFAKYVAKGLLCVVLVTIRLNQRSWNDLSSCKGIAVRGVGLQAGAAHCGL